MPASGQLGIFWGTNSFSIVETSNDQITNILKVPFDTEIEQDETQENVPDDLKFPVILKKSLEFRSIKSTLTNLSIPTHDLIFRSFMIPFMEKSEIQNVIEFEITKYIPLKLEELVYTYHTVPYYENNQKSLRVLFIAVRKNRLEEMVKTISQAGLTLQNIEPAPVSLIHLLKKHKLLSNKKESTAILNLSDEGTEIIVIKDETLNFMRKLNVHIDQLDLATLQNTLQNEVRVSFNFFARQNQDEDISRLIIISQHKIPNIEETLAKDLSVPVSFAPIEKFIPIEDHQSISHLNALGTMLRKEKFSTKFFDLSDSAIEMQRSGKDPLESLKRYGLMAGICLGCALAIFLTFFLGNKMMENNRKKLNEIQSKLGSYTALNIPDLNTKKDDMFSNLKNYTKVRTDSRIALLMAEIPKMLPLGTWLDSFEITYSDSATNVDPKMLISLTGKIYSDDPNQQFYLLSEIIGNLKNNETINTYYSNVTRSNAERTTENGHVITTFTIICD